MTSDSASGTRFGGRVAVVTGAAKGIGAAVARQLAADGATVACLDVALDGAEKTAADLSEGGAVAAAYRCDVADEASVASSVAAVAAGLGAPKIVCNVAGIGWFSHTVSSTLDDWNRVIGVNLTGTFLVSRACLPYLVDGGGGAIVNIASSAGLVGQPYSAAYCASKGGVVMLTKALAWEYVRKGVRVNAVAPGGIETDILNGFMPPEGANMKLIGKLVMPMGFGKPDDVARVVAFLASDETGYLTGTVVPVDGGMTS